MPASGDVRKGSLPPRSAKSWFAGAVANTVMARQEALGSEELGRHMTWFPPDDESRRIAPGQSLSGIAVDSDFLPGFTTAWFSSMHWPRTQFDDNWPLRIRNQLDFFADPQYSEAMLLVVGPMFPPGSAPPPIAANFQAGIRQLVNSRRLNPSSPFVRALSTALDGPPAQWRAQRLPAPPADPTQRLLARAAELSLGIRIAPARP